MDMNEEVANLTQHLIDTPSITPGESMNKLSVGLYSLFQILAEQGVIDYETYNRRVAQNSTILDQALAGFWDQSHGRGEWR